MLDSAKIVERRSGTHGDFSRLFGRWEKRRARKPAQGLRCATRQSGGSKNDSSTALCFPSCGNPKGLAKSRDLPSELSAAQHPQETNAGRGLHDGEVNLPLVISEPGERRLERVDDDQGALEFYVD